MTNITRLARIRHLLRSSQVRLALGLVAVFVIVNFASLGFAWVQLLNKSEDQINLNLEQQIARFSKTDNPGTFGALVETEAADVDPKQRVVIFVAPDGRSFGNARAEMRGGEIDLKERDAGRELSDDGYSFRSKAMAAGVLIVGESRAPISDMQETFFGLLSLAIFPTLLISLGAGVWMALVSARRVRHIESTLAQLTRGDLSARVPSADQNDDLSRIGAGINRMGASQEASMSALRQVSTDIAHDLKTPIQRIFVLLKNLRDGLAKGTPEADLADRALTETERAATVFQSLLMIAQIEGGSAKSRFDAIDLTQIVSMFVEIYEPAAEDSGHSLVKTLLPETPVIVHGDKTLLGQLIANLIENALRHTPAGSSISLGIELNPQEIMLRVADNGPGIPEGERDNVLRRLYRLERSRTTTGNGLGLSHALAIAELHEARLRLLDNSPGLCVEVALPRSAGDQQQSI